MDNFKDFTLDLLFPKFCLGCNFEGSYLCEDCRAVLDICEFDYCLCEKNPQIIPQNQNTGKCSRCQDKKLSGLYFALPYQEKMLTKKLIYQFKYEPYLKDLSKTLANILAEHFIKTGRNTNQIWEKSVLVPVPMDKNKIKIRGYNQSEELAKELAKILKIPVISGNLCKTRHTDPQMTLKKEEREKNLQNAFKIKNPAELEGKKVFLVDDVYTTGSTMQECAKTLKESGTKQVWGICIARDS